MTQPNMNKVIVTITQPNLKGFHFIAEDTEELAKEKTLLYMNEQKTKGFSVFTAIMHMPVDLQQKGKTFTLTNQEDSLVAIKIE